MAAGITTQYGFLYQRYVFIKMVLENVGANKFFIYEGIDDIDILEKDGIFSIKFPNKSYVQVKSGNVSRDCWAKVIGNWLLTEGNNSTYKIILEKELTFDIKSKDVVSGVLGYFINGEIKATSSIANKVFKKFTQGHNNSMKILEEKITELTKQVSCEVFSVDCLKENIEENFKTTYCQDIKIYEMAKKCRCKRFIDYINAAIDEAISKKRSFMLRYVDFVNIFKMVSSEISDGKYSINIGEMKKRKRAEAERLASSDDFREVRQLRLVNKETGFIVNELLKELLYRDFRNIYAASESTLISNIEETAFSNYEDTIYSLTEHLSPERIFYSTVEKEIPLSIVENSPLYRHGCYVFLTSDGADEERKITWGGRNG